MFSGFCYKWINLMPQRRACTFIYVSEQYLLSPLIQCFHSKRNTPISSTLSIHCLIVVTMSYQTKNPVRSFLQNKRPFLQQDFQQDFNSSVNWQKHWPSRLKHTVVCMFGVFVNFPMHALPLALHIPGADTDELRYHASAQRWKLV